MNAALLATALLCPCSDMKDGSSARTPEPFVIDFAPALAANGDFYHLLVLVKGGKSLENGIYFRQNMTATDIRNFVYNDNREYLCAKPIGKTKLAIYTFFDGSPVTAVKMSGVPVIVTPKNSYREER